MGIQLKQPLDSKRTVQQCSAVSRIWESETQGDDRWPYSVHFKFANATSSACEEEQVDFVIFHDISIYNHIYIFPIKGHQESPSNPLRINY